MADRLETLEVHSSVEQLDLPVDIEGVVRDSPKGSGLLLAKHGKSGIVRGLFREPLLHFLIAGALIFALGTLFDRSTNNGVNGNRIQVAAPEIQRLREVWTRQWGHAPDSSQMKYLIDDYIREEVLYREAQASGLDKDDTIIHRRLVEKMEFLSQELASSAPSEEDIQEYFQQNREKFRSPEQVAFSHIYFSISKRGPTSEEDARGVLTALSSGTIPLASGSGLGDSFMLQNEYPLQTQRQIKELFGDEFARKLFLVDSGAWAGPIRSGYGFHLVRVSQKLPSRIPELAEVQNQVLTDFQNHRLQIASQTFYDRVRRHYQVEIDKAALSAAESQQSTPTKPGTQGALSPDLD
jgi:peptidyl-prolyl cis-trans isomerase C